MIIGAIVYFSRQPFAQQDLSPLIRSNQQIITFVKEQPQVKFYYHHRLIDSHADTVAFIQFIIRKTVHFLLYGALGISLLIALTQERPTFRNWLWAGIFVLLIAGGDELNQLQMQQRTGCIPDVILDGSGFVIISLPYMMIRSRR